MRALLLLALAMPLGAQEIYDLLLKNGHVLDPANGRNGVFDVAVIGTKIVHVGHDLPASHARVVVDAGQYFVTPGLIDIHTHFNWAGSAVSLMPDSQALPSGVTTAVDAGSSNAKTFDEFKKTAIDHSRTRLLAFLDAGTDAEAAARLARKYPQIIVGLTSAGKVANALVMGEAGAVKDLGAGDIATHVYSRTTASPEALAEARRRGVLFDVGHGSAGFWFRVAVPMIRRGFLPDTISSDIDKDSIMLPRATMIDTMSKLLNIGMTMEQVIERSTVNPARAIHRTELGTLSEGATADIAVIERQEGKFGFLDSGHARLVGDKKLACVMTVRNGQVVWDTEGLSLTDAGKAGPYTNFK